MQSRRKREAAARARGREQDRQAVQPASPAPRVRQPKPDAELEEPVLADDYPIYGNYLYVVDGRVIRSDWHDITARQLRNYLGAQEVRRCDMAGRDLL